MSRTIICDIETDGFLDELTRCWTIQIGDADGDDVTVYADQPGYPSIKKGLKRIAEADRVVFHNGMKFDVHALNKLYPGAVDPYKVFDTLVAARILFPEAQSHSLDDWGRRLGVFKGQYTGGFERFSEELVKYARQDIVVTRALYDKCRREMEKWDWSRCLWIEFLFQFAMALQEQNGFLLDVEAARALEVELRQQLADLYEELGEAFPPRFTYKDATPEKSRRAPKRKWSKKGKAVESPYTAIKLQEFNPGSRQQAIDRLQEKYGWKPFKKTELGNPMLDEEVLKEMHYPEAKLLYEYLHTEKMLGQIVNKKGDKGWLVFVNEDTHRVHGAINPQGAGTGRCAHFRPNMAQVSKDKRMRGCWIPRKGWKLVGVDADGLEFVCLAHYCAKYDGGAAVEFHIKGDKKKGTDVHSRNRDSIVKAFLPKLKLTDKGLLAKLRDFAKTTLYALIYGGQNPRLAVSIMAMLAMLDHHPKVEAGTVGQKGRKAIARNLPGLDKTIEYVKRRANKNGFVKGIDGRKIPVRSQHSAFNFLCQGAGAIVMKLAVVIFYFERMTLFGLEHGVDYAFCSNVHDEVQIECKPEYAELIRDEMISSITEAAVRLGFRCPLTGEGKIGDSWAETH